MKKDFQKWHDKKTQVDDLAIAFGSGSELESQLEIAKILFPNLDYRQAEILLIETMKILDNFLITGSVKILV